MIFAILTHVPHSTSQKQYFAYVPYVREMNLWFKHVDEVLVVAPKVRKEPTTIDMPYEHANIQFNTIPSIQFTSFKNSFSSFLKTPIIVWTIFKACKKADHIHLRCPGNIGLLGCLVQIVFPKKTKTAKYAGNWDPNAKQPLSYKFQKWILRNTFLTRNMQVLVYGEWKHQTKNIKPFFTATYRNSEIEEPKKRDYSDALKFVFIGSLVDGKRPFLAIQIVEALHKEGKNVYLDVYGDGVLKTALQNYIIANKLEKIIYLHGNQSKEIVKETLRTAHFTILPSKSEGWPKAIAEGMFFGTIPIATSVSCVPYILDFGNRGILIEAHLNQDVASIMNALKDSGRLQTMSEKAAKWSQNFTLEVFETEIPKLLHHS
jgi:glycosyltransferase involved in cell wall biosynthesis